MSKVYDYDQLMEELFDEMQVQEELKEQFFDDILIDHRYMRDVLKKELGLGRYNVEIRPNLKVKGGPA